MEIRSLRVNSERLRSSDEHSATGYKAEDEPRRHLQRHYLFMRAGL